MERKPLLLILCVGIIPFAVSAQVSCPVLQEEPTRVDHEIGVNLFSWISVLPDYIGYDGGSAGYANGLFCKLHYGRNTLRLGADVFRDNYRIGSPLGAGSDYPTGHAYREGSSSDVRFRIGYQRSFGKGRLKPFVGMDVGCRFFHEKYVYEGNGDFVYNPSWGSSTTSKVQPFIAALVGLNYQPMKHWSFTVEAACTYLNGSSTEDRSEHSFLFPQERSSSFSRRERGLSLDPLRVVGVSYHF